MSSARGWEAIVDLALAEDIGSGDITAAATVSADARAEGVMLVKGWGTLSGFDAAAYAFRAVDPAIRFTPRLADGADVDKGTVIADLEGPARSILTAERTALNLIQRLSGVATSTREYVLAVQGTRATIVDTRKTTPGMRVLEKAAVRHGGGSNHRFGLFDGVLIKDNHLAAIGGPDRITQALRRARALAPHTLKIEVEVTTLAEAAEAADAGADIIMLDNMTIELMTEAVAIISGRAMVEASGGVNMHTVRAIAETGVDLISIGALTHSAPSLDISLDFAIR